MVEFSQKEIEEMEMRKNGSDKKSDIEVKKINKEGRKQRKEESNKKITAGRKE